MINTEEYRLAIAGEGPLAYEWSDKPHRLVYDLAAEVDRLRARVDAVDRAVAREHCQDPVHGLGCLHNEVAREFFCLPCSIRVILVSGNEVQS